MTTDSNTPASDADNEAQIAEFVKALDAHENHENLDTASAEEDRTLVILLVHNGLVLGGQPQMIPSQHFVTPTSLMRVQSLLAEDVLPSSDAVSLVKAAVADIVEDPALAERVAAHLAKLELVK